MSNLNSAENAPITPTVPEWIKPLWTTEQLTSKVSLQVDETFQAQTDAMIADGLVSSMKNQIEYGLASFDWMLRQSAKGKLIVALDVKTNSYKEIAMPPLDRARELGDAMTWNKMPSQSV